MSTQNKYVTIFTKNHAARIQSKTYSDGKVTSTSKRDDGFVVFLDSSSEGQLLTIRNPYEGGVEGVSLTGTQIRTLRRVLDKHYADV